MKFHQYQLAWKDDASNIEKQLRQEKVAGPALPKILQSSMKFPLCRVIGQYDHETKSRWCRQFPMIKQLRWQLAVIGQERENSVRKVRKRYEPREEKSGKLRLRANSAPSTAHGTISPHTRVQAQVPGWVGKIQCCAWTVKLLLGKWAQGGLN